MAKKGGRRTKRAKKCPYGVRKAGRGAGTTCRKHKPRRKSRRARHESLVTF